MKSDSMYNPQRQDRVAGFSFAFLRRNPSLVKSSPVTVLAIVQERSSTEDLCFMGAWTRREPIKIGDNFVRLTVLAETDPSPLAGLRRWLCQCECGRIIKAIDGALKSGNTRSCGCLKIELAALRLRSHGQTANGRTPAYKAWAGLKGRCLNPTNEAYKDYGGRGITVCERYRESFEAFYADVKDRPSAKHSLDRINNNGHYSCGQCEQCIENGWPMNLRWATKREQSRNQRGTHPVTINGITKLLTEWAEESGISSPTLRRRIKRNVPEDELLAPVKTQYRHKRENLTQVEKSTIFTRRESGESLDSIAADLGCALSTVSRVARTIARQVAR